MLEVLGRIAFGLFGVACLVGVTALETTIGDRAPARIGLHPPAQPGGDVARQGGIRIAAEIEIRQTALEESRHTGGDRMRFEQDRVTMAVSQRRQHRLQRVVVRIEIVLDPICDLAVARCLPRPVQRRLREAAQRTQFRGGGAGIQRSPAGIAVQVDDIARVARPQRAGAQNLGEVVELRQVPVGIRNRERHLGVALGPIRRQLGTGMRHADQQRGITQVQRVGQVLFHQPIFPFA